jgi:type IV pilus assembly protein PilP
MTSRANPTRRAAGSMLLALLAARWPAAAPSKKNCKTGWSSSGARSSPTSAAAAPKKFEPEAYTSAQAVDPFSNQKLSVALKQEARQPNSMLAPSSTGARSRWRPTRWTA